jgi:hypothetical protein
VCFSKGALVDYSMGEEGIKVLYCVTIVLQWWYSGVTVVVQWCYSSITVVLQWYHIVCDTQSYTNTCLRIYTYMHIDIRLQIE